MTDCNTEAEATAGMVTACLMQEYLNLLDWKGLEPEEAGIRSKTWAVLRALQQVNSATRIDGEAAMFARPFFQSAGQGDLLFWGKKKDQQ